MVGTDASNCPQPHPAAFRSLWGHGAVLAPRCLLSLSARRPGSGLPVLDDLCVITADNEIFNHHLYYRGSAEAGRKPLPFGQGCAAFAGGFGARFGAGGSWQSQAVPAWWPMDGGCSGDIHLVSPSLVDAGLLLCRAPLGGLLWGHGGHRPSLGARGSFCPSASSPLSPEM